MVGLFPERREKAGGWPKVLTVIEVQILRNMALDKSLTVADTCKTVNVSKVVGSVSLLLRERPPLGST